MAKTLKELAREALSVQDACNLCGVVQSFARAMRDLSEALPDAGTDAKNTHPITLLWSDKVAHLTGTQTFGDDSGKMTRAYAECGRLANA